MEFRNTCQAFHLDGTFEMLPTENHQLHIVRSYGEHKAELEVDFLTKEIIIRYLENGNTLFIFSNIRISDIV